MRSLVLVGSFLLLLATVSATNADVYVRCGVTTAPTQPGYYNLTTNDPGYIGTLTGSFTNVDASVCPSGTMTVSLSGGVTAGTTTLAPFYRDRGAPADNGYFTNGPLYQTFAGYAQATGSYLWTTIGGLQPNTSYSMTVYAYDNFTSGTMTYSDYSSGTAATSGSITWTASHVFANIRDTSNNLYSTTMLVTSNASGNIILRGTGDNIINGFDLSPMISEVKVGTTSGDCELYSDTSIGITGGTALVLGESGVDSNNCRAFIPFSISGTTTITSVQAAANINLLVYLRGSTAPAFTVDLYGYPNRGSATAAANGDYSGGTLLVPGVLTSASLTGWNQVDVTQYVQQQVDAGNTAVCFKLQIHETGLPNTDGHQNCYAINPADYGITTAPNLQITINRSDSTTIDNKVLAGYAAWLRCPGDGDASTLNQWIHWSTGHTLSAATFGCNFYPDMSTYSTGEKYLTGFNNADGTPASLFSSANARTALRHCAWMGRYGIDTLMLEEFGSDLPPVGNRYLQTYPPSTFPTIQSIETNVVSATQATGRTWVVAYDMSGLTSSNVASIFEYNWQRLVSAGYTSRPNYLHEGGKPVVYIFGFYPGDTGRPMNDPTVGQPIIDWFHAQGVYVMGSGDWNFVSDGAQSANTSWYAMVNTLDAFTGWNVGHGSLGSDGKEHQSCSFWQSDLNTFPGKFIPDVVPGADTTTAYAPNGINNDRNYGNFMWEQFQYISTLKQNGTGPGINTIFLTQLDDFVEGDQILPVVDVPPPGTVNMQSYSEGGPTLPSTCYMQWVSAGGLSLKTGQPIPTGPPPTPDPY